MEERDEERPAPDSIRSQAPSSGDDRRCKMLDLGVSRICVVFLSCVVYEILSWTRVSSSQISSDKKASGAVRVGVQRAAVIDRFTLYAGPVPSMLRAKATLNCIFPAS